MECNRCHNDFEEKNIQESHDVPLYLFEGTTRKERKVDADKYNRKWLCKNCHDEYEEELNQALIQTAIKFSEGWENGNP